MKFVVGPCVGFRFGRDRTAQLRVDLATRFSGDWGIMSVYSVSRGASSAESSSTGNGWPAPGHGSTRGFGLSMYLAHENK